MYTPDAQPLVVTGRAKTCGIACSLQKVRCCEGALLRGATSCVEVRLTHGSGLLSIESNEVLKVIWNSRILKDRLNWALSFTSTAMNTLIWVNHEHTDVVTLLGTTVLVVIFLLLDVVEAVDRTNLNAGTIFGAQTIYSNNVSHDC